MRRDRFVPLPVSTGELGTGCTHINEAYEGILVQLTNAHIASAPNNYGEVTINDLSGPTQMDDHFADSGWWNGAQMMVGHVLSSVVGVHSPHQCMHSLRSELSFSLTSAALCVVQVGVVSYGYGAVELLPRRPSDIVYSGTFHIFPPSPAPAPTQAWVPAGSHTHIAASPHRRIAASLHAQSRRNPHSPRLLCTHSHACCARTASLVVHAPGWRVRQ
jgi:hypothetical protein